MDLVFGSLDVSPYTDTLLPHTQEAVLRAVEAVLYFSGVQAGQQEDGVPCSAGTAGAHRREFEVLGVRADAAWTLMLAPYIESGWQTQSHAVWIRELAPLARPSQAVDFKYLKFGATDVLAIVDSFSGAKVWVVYTRHMGAGSLLVILASLHESRAVVGPGFEMGAPNCRHTCDGSRQHNAIPDSYEPTCVAYTLRVDLSSP